MYHNYFKQKSIDLIIIVRNDHKQLIGYMYMYIVGPLWL